MSVCFFVPAEQSAAGAEDADGDCGPEDAIQTESIYTTLQNYWQKVNDDLKNVTPDDFKTQVLPLARIKKIMKLDEEVKMISAEAPVLFAKAAEIFIHELTLRAWAHTEDNKRRTLQRNDIAMAISKSDQFDFLIDIVPRHEVKPAKHEPPRPPPAATAAATAAADPVAPPAASAPQPHYIVQPQMVQGGGGGSGGGGAAHPVALVQQLVGGEGGQLQLTQAQLNMIRLQVQNNPGQPVLIQAQPHSPQIIQVSSQAPHQPQQIFLAQVAAQEET
ncbi:nuclear transcription factor Y subunit C-6 [Aricia agestis]|uniref:nuclear transcription factor Y subunit C-6 n=1 Tax=Aricia agestis TaxID=91739 RepID=UPI001C202D10|nr:nuclear transcription factor Y subunit C-6 [Aricia agestis]